MFSELAHLAWLMVKENDPVRFLGLIWSYSIIGLDWAGYLWICQIIVCSLMILFWHYSLPQYDQVSRLGMHIPGKLDECPRTLVLPGTFILLAHCPRLSVVSQERRLCRKVNITQTLNQRIDSLYRHISLIENTFILNPARKYPQIEEIKDAIGKGIWDDFFTLSLWSRSFR